MIRPKPIIKIWLVIAISFFCSRSFSATPIGIDKQIDTDKQKNIDKTVTGLNSVNFIKGQFAQLKKLQGLSYSLKAQGHFIFWKNQGLYLVTEKPFFNAFTITSSAMINWQENGEASIAQEQAGIIQNEINKTLLAFFSADITSIEQKFNAEWIFNKESWQLTLTPKLDIIKKNMQQAVIQGNRYMESLKLIAGNGDLTTITFSAHQESKEPSAEECRRFYMPPQTACKTYQ